MYHSVVIGPYNTYRDFFMIPTERPLIQPPSLEEKIMEFYDGDGVFDESNFLNSTPAPISCEGDWTFAIENDKERWPELYSRILNSIHGRRFVVYLEDFPAARYEGRVIVSSLASADNWTEVTVSYDLERLPTTSFVLGKSVLGGSDTLEATDI